MAKQVVATVAISGPTAATSAMKVAAEAEVCCVSFGSGGGGGGYDGERLR